jgi:hypothetical protein
MQVNVQPSTVVATFEILPLINPAKTKTAGRPIYDELEVCRIRFAGNRSTVGVFPANEVFKHAPDETGFMQPVTYAMEFQDAYLKFKQGAAQTVGGTPLSELPFLTVGKRLELKALNIHTAETLAALDGNALKSLGMGGRELKDHAVAYLETAAATHSTAQLNEALAIRDQEIADLKAKVAALSNSEPDAGSAASPFADFSTEDMVNWITTADPATKIDARWGKAKLVEIADKINVRLSKAA